MTRLERGGGGSKVVEGIFNSVRKDSILKVVISKEGASVEGVTGPPDMTMTALTYWTNSNGNWKNCSWRPVL